MTVFDYYSCILQIGKKFNLPEQISRYTFDFLKKDIQSHLNFVYLDNKISICESKKNELYIFHLRELPYQIVTIEEAAHLIESIIKEKGINFIFNRYCCKKDEETPPAGMVFCRLLKRKGIRFQKNRIQIYD